MASKDPYFAASNTEKTIEKLIVYIKTAKFEMHNEHSQKYVDKTLKLLEAALREMNEVKDIMGGLPPV